METRIEHQHQGVGGILKGSPEPDTCLCWLECWMAEFGLMAVGQKIPLVHDVSYTKREPEFNDFVFPEHPMRVHSAGAPLSAQVEKHISGNRCSFSEFGTGDGITPLADEVSEGGTIVAGLGLDHHDRSPDIDLKGLALALAAGETVR